jgi:hypothetical protein
MDATSASDGLNRDSEWLAGDSAEQIDGEPRDLHFRIVDVFLDASGDQAGRRAPVNGAWRPGAACERSWDKEVPVAVKDGVTQVWTSGVRRR